MLTILLIAAAGALMLRPLPTLLLPQSRKHRDFVAVLENFVDQSRAGVAIPLALQGALEVDFLPDDQLGEFITAKFDGDPLAEQFALMWRNLFRRGGGIVDGAAALAHIGVERRAQDEELAVKTSGARATFKLLVLLPVWFLVIGQLVGLPALSVLLSHLWGYLLLAIASLLMWVGHRWMAHILESV